MSVAGPRAGRDEVLAHEVALDLGRVVERPGERGGDPLRHRQLGVRMADPVRAGERAAAMHERLDALTAMWDGSAHHLDRALRRLVRRAGEVRRYRAHRHPCRYVRCPHRHKQNRVP